MRCYLCESDEWPDVDGCEVCASCDRLICTDACVQRDDGEVCGSDCQCCGCNQTFCWHHMIEHCDASRRTSMPTMEADQGPSACFPDVAFLKSLTTLKTAMLITSSERGFGDHLPEKYRKTLNRFLNFVSPGHNALESVFRQQVGYGWHREELPESGVTVTTFEQGFFGRPVFFAILALSAKTMGNAWSRLDERVRERIRRQLLAVDSPTKGLTSEQFLTLDAYSNWSHRGEAEWGLDSSHVSVWVLEENSSPTTIAEITEGLRKKVPESMIDMAEWFQEEADIFKPA